MRSSSHVDMFGFMMNLTEVCVPLLMKVLRDEDDN